MSLSYTSLPVDTSCGLTPEMIFEKFNAERKNIENRICF